MENKFTYLQREGERERGETDTQTSRQRQRDIKGGREVDGVGDGDK